MTPTPHKVEKGAGNRSPFTAPERDAIMAELRPVLERLSACHHCKPLTIARLANVLAGEMQRPSTNRCEKVLGDLVGAGA